MDKIAQWLQREGLQTQSAYLTGSGLLLGQQFELPPYQVIYRIEADALIICGFSRVADSLYCQPQQLFHLWGILRRLFLQYPRLKRLQMLVVTDVFDTKLAGQRRQLAQLLLSLGATFTVYDNDRWLVLSAEKLIHRKRHKTSEAL